MLKLYLDLCCLKRPFDDPSQERIRLEIESVLSILSLPPAKVAFMRTSAHDLENDQNPVFARAARVRRWLEELPLASLPDRDLARKTDELVALGFKNFDAFHLASAELSGASAFVTCDDRLLALAGRHAASVRVRVVDPVSLAREVLT